MKLGDDEARTRFAAARVARMASVNGDGAPHLVPVTFAVDGTRIYVTVDHKPKSSRRLKRLDNIARNPRVSLIADFYGEDWEQLWWVRADGEAAIVTDAVEIRHPVDVLARRYEQYRAQRPQGPVIVIRVDRWTGWSSS